MSDSKKENKKVQKPIFEKIDNVLGSSFRVRQYADPDRDKTPYWHVHPEYELIYINGGNGKRHIGSHMSYFTDGDLIFIGANLPHFGFTDRITGNKSETIVQMKEGFLGEGFFDIPEMRPIKTLFDRARLGIVFHSPAKEEIGSSIERLVELDYFDRLVGLLTIFKSLALTTHFTVLNVDTLGFEVSVQENERISKIYEYIKSAFRRTISLEEMADVANMTVPSFCRYFKKMSGKTFTQFTNEYRLVHASKLLAESPQSVSNISLECGFNNFSHFSKLFKKYAGKSPMDYRKENRVIVS